MNTKLTLTIEESIIQQAKVYAKLNKRSLSDIIENYLKSLTQDKSSLDKDKPSPIIQSLQGAFKLSGQMDYKKELQNRRDRKYM